jgi:hypothetical protein
LQEKLDALFARQEEIDKQIKTKQAAASTISKVLSEILSKIFAVYVRDFGGSPYDVANVCRMWRSVVLHHSPGIWGRILLIVPQATLQSSWEDGFFVCFSPVSLEKALERSKDKKVCLRLRSGASDKINLSDLLPYRPIFENSKERWESLDVELPTIVNDTSDNADGTTAATLFSTLTYPSNSLSSLRHLKLTNIDLTEEPLISSPTLETLSLTRCQFDLSNVDYPALVELDFDTSSTPSTLVRMPNLRLLRYRGPTLTPLMQMTAPSLQTLDLASLDNSTWLDGGWGSRFNPRVLLLRLGGWNRAVFKAFLGWVSNMESLSVEATTFLTAMEILEELEQGEMVSLEGAGEEITQQPAACPNLSALDITITEEVCGECISQLRSLSEAVLKKYRLVSMLRLKANGITEKICY